MLNTHTHGGIVATEKLIKRANGVKKWQKETPFFHKSVSIIIIDEEYSKCVYVCGAFIHVTQQLENMNISILGANFNIQRECEICAHWKHGTAHHTMWNHQFDRQMNSFFFNTMSSLLVWIDRNNKNAVWLTEKMFATRARSSILRNESFIVICNSSN